MAKGEDDEGENGGGCQHDQAEQGADEPDCPLLFTLCGLGDTKEVDKSACDEGEESHVHLLSRIRYQMRRATSRIAKLQVE